MMFINYGRATKDHLCPKLLLFTSVLTVGICQLYCPELAEVGNSAQLTCIYPNYNLVSYRPPYGKFQVAACKPDGNCTVNGGDRFSATNINKTHSRLMITNVQVSDGGNWTCEDAFSSVRKGCTFYPFKTPTCHITSRKDTNNLDIHEDISLSVNVTDYYCSTSFDFLLRVGNTEEVLIKSTVKEINITSDVLNSTFNVTESHIGSMELIFICNDVRKAVKCGGVRTLRKRQHTTCTLLHDSGSSYVRKISVIAGTVAAVSCIVTFGILIAWFLKVHTTKSKLVSVACQADIRPENMGSEDLGASAEVGDINGTEFARSVTDIEMVSAVGFADREKIRKYQQRLHNTGTDGKERTLDYLDPVHKRQSLESSGYASVTDEITVPVNNDVSLESGSDVRSTYHHLQLETNDHIYTTVNQTSHSRCTII